MVKTRNEISDEYKWNLEAMYKTDDDFNKDCIKLEDSLKEVSKYQDTFTSSSKNLLNMLDLSCRLERLSDKLVVYSSMRLDEDTSNTYYQSLKGKAYNISSKLAEATSFIMPKLLEIDYKTITEYMKQEHKLQEYEFYLKNIYRFKDHTLSSSEEEMLSILGNTFNIPDETASLLRNSDMTFGIIIDENNHKVELTNSNYSIYMSSDSRKVRKKAFKALYKTYISHINTLSSTLKGEVEIATKLAKIKHYGSSMERALFNNNIPLSIYDNLISTVNDNMKYIYKYYDMKKKILKLKDIHLYDVYADLIKGSSKKYTFDEAKDLVFKALDILGSTYIKDARKAFSERWIDIYPNRNKKSGAYSWGCYDSYPYMCLNYQGQIHDVSTLAHELGHSMHSYYSHNNNPYQTAHYRIFVAEVASTTNELLLYKYMLKVSTNKNERLTILNSILELFKSTIYRQTMFAEFEKEIHRAEEQGEVLTHKYLSDLYYDLNKKYFGSHVVIDDEIRYEWSRIPHFYMNFYVYQYATGLSAACYIVNRILNNEPNAKEDYMNFLKTGGSDYPVSELKIAGVDMNSSEVIKSALDMFNDTMDEFTKEYNN